jgi:hypothetical protein
VLIKPGVLTDVIGFAALALVLLGQQTVRPLSPAPDPPGE